MSLYHQFQTTITFANLIPLLQTYIYKFETIIQNSCSEGYDEDNFVQSYQHLKLCIVL